MRTPAGARFAPVELQIDRGVVWAVGLGGALRIDPRRNVPDLYVPVADKTGESRGIVTDGESVWVLTADGRLRLYDARTGRAAGGARACTGHRRGQVALPEPGVTAMAKVGRELWVATPSGKIVVVR